MTKHLVVAAAVAVLASPLAAQQRTGEGFVELGLVTDSNGPGVSFAISAGLQVRGLLHGELRWLSLGRGACSTDGGSPCRGPARVIEAGPSLRFGESPRVGAFVGLGVGQFRVQRSLGFHEASIGLSTSVGLDVRVAPPMAFRLLVRYQEVLDGGGSGGANTRLVTMAVGIGVSFN